jgi:hypothetical protein
MRILSKEDFTKIQSHELRMDTQDDVPFPLLEENNHDITANPYSGLFTGWTYFVYDEYPGDTRQDQENKCFSMIVFFRKYNSRIMVEK